MAGEGANLLGTKVGGIRFVDILGEGGMGHVYAGIDEKLDRRVALKIIRKEFSLSQDVKARLQREARILSKLDHPNICRIFDLLEGPDFDVLVLELVKGQSLRQAMKKGLDAPSKNRIARQLLEVLEVAHAKGIIHRDLKPDNVMITEAGDVKVLDFGLARTLEEEFRFQAAPTQGVDADGSVTDQPSQPIRTRLGSIMGTPGYMSPEQARGEEATTASDVYSLGLLLQELFTGEPPFDPSSGVQERLDRSARAESRAIKGLDSDMTAFLIRLKSEVPSARPSAVDALALLQAIIEKPRRKKVRIIAAAGVCALALFAISMAVLSVRLAREVERANREAEASRQVAGFLTRLFSVSDPGESRGNSITARELLDRGSASISSELRDQPKLQAQLMETMGTVYRTLGLYQQAAPLLEQSLEVRKKLLGPDSPEVASAETELGYVYWRQGKSARAQALLKDALSIREKVLGADSLEAAETLNTLAGVYWSLGQTAEVQALCERALAIRKKKLGESHPDVAKSLLNLAILHDQRGNFVVAEEYYRQALEIQERALGFDHPEIAITLNNLAALFDAQKRFRDAEPLYLRAIAISEKVLGRDHPDTATALNNLADVYRAEGNPEKAEPLYRQALKIWELKMGPEHPDTAYALFGLGETLAVTGDWKGAEPLLTRALAIRQKSLPPEDPDRLETEKAYSELLSKVGKKN